jgi:phosphatidylglycerol:prolipoprotein diacylglycerol transferase
MIPLLLPYPEIDPIAFTIGPVAVRWYGLAYMFGLLFAWIYVRRLLQTPALWPGQPPIVPDKTDDLLLWVTLGVVVGGRLGNVLLFDPAYYFANPLEIFAVWKGGMAFHGALLGVILAIYLFARANKAPMFAIADLVSAAAPMGIFFGRLANFINQEVVGRVSDVPWAVVFPLLGEPARHPSQLYEAVLEGLALFLLLRYFTHARKALGSPGLVTGIFLLGYGSARIFCEFFRDYDPSHALATAYSTPSMAYSLPMIALGGFLIWRTRGQQAVA